MMKSRELCAPGVGPPKGPVAFRVSTTRQGFTGTNSNFVGSETAAMDNACGMETELPSEKVILKLNGLPIALVGVPLITPAGSRVSPGGSAPPLIVQFL